MQFRSILFFKGLNETLIELNANEVNKLYLIMLIYGRDPTDGLFELSDTIFTVTH